MSSILITGASKGIGRATAAELARRGHRVVATAGPVSSGALDDVLAYRLPDDPYAGLFAEDGIPAAAMMSPEQVAENLADLAERPAVPLRMPVGNVAERVIAARNAAPYDQPFVRA